MCDISSRIMQINDAINKNIKSIYHIIRLPIKNARYYAVILKKNNEKNISDRINDFYEFLNSIKLQEEQLIIKNRCFYLVCKNYELVYCLEFYYKSPEKIGYIESNIPKIDFLHRMGTEMASKRYSWLDNEKKEIVKVKMSEPKLMEIKPNIFDRFAFIVKNIDYKS